MLTDMTLEAGGRGGGNSPHAVIKIKGHHQIYILYAPSKQNVSGPFFLAERCVTDMMVYLRLLEEFHIKVKRQSLCYNRP